MLTRNDQPIGNEFDFATNANQLNFAVDSVFTAANSQGTGGTPPPSNAFLLLDNEVFNLLDGTSFLLL